MKHISTVEKTNSTTTTPDCTKLTHSVAFCYTITCDEDHLCLQNEKGVRNEEKYNREDD